MAIADTKFISEAIEKEVRRRVEAAILDETAKVAERVSQIFSNEADRIALVVLKYYEVAQFQGQVVITVRKPEQ